MGDEERQLIKCASCCGLFRIDMNTASPFASCPHCGVEIVVPGREDANVPVAFPSAAPKGLKTIAEETEVLYSPARKGTPETGGEPSADPKGPKTIAEGTEVLFSPARGKGGEDSSTPSPPAPDDPGPSSPSGEIPSQIPPAKDSAPFEVESVVIRDTNRAPVPPSHKERKESSAPLLEHHERLASTEESRFARDEEAEAKMAEAVRVERAERKLVTWEADQPTRKKSRGGRKPGQRLRKSLIATGTVFVAALFFWVIVSGLFQGFGGGRGGITPTVPTEENEDDATKMVRDDVSQSIATIESFLKAADARERLQFCRSKDRVAPLLAQYEDPQFSGPVAYREIRQDFNMQLYKNFFVTRVVLDDFSEQIVAVEKTADGEFLVDWESFVAHCDLPWAQLMEEKPTAPKLVRVLASPDTYFNFGFAADEYLCYRLQSRSGAYTLYGYAPFGSDIALKLRDAIRKDGDGRPLLTLRVAFPSEKKSDNQVLITNLLSVGWVIRERSEDEDLPTLPDSAP